jgi:hypothetical protein
MSSRRDRRKVLDTFSALEPVDPWSVNKIRIGWNINDRISNLVFLFFWQVKRNFELRTTS